MICDHCHCQAPEAGHGLPEECLEALLAWRKEADQRLIGYEMLAAERQGLLEQADHFLMLREPEADPDYAEFREQLRLVLGGA